MTVTPIRSSAQVIDLRLARIRRLAAEHSGLRVLVGLAMHLAKAGRDADRDTLAAAATVGWSDGATYAERAAAVETINRLLRAHRPAIG